MQTPMTQEEIAKAYDRAREETQEITRIKNDFIARLEMAGMRVRVCLCVCAYACVPMTKRASKHVSVCVCV